MRFLASKSGTVHVIHAELDMSSCPVVTKAKKAGTWKGQRSLKPEAVLEMGDCINCESHKHARSEIKKDKAAAKTANAGAKKVGKVTSPARAPKLAANHPVADERTTAKAEEHAKIAADHGWAVNVDSNNHGGLTVTAVKGDETCVLAYQRNGVLFNKEIVFKVPGRSVPLHNSGTWRRQVSLPEGKRPISAKPKRAGRAPKVVVAVDPGTDVTGVAVVREEDTIPLNQASLPFPHDAEDIVILDHIKGRTLYWRNNMMAKVVSATVPAKARMIRFGHTGRAQRRYVSFPETTMSADGEVYGAERSVAIEDMLRVK